MSRRGGSLSDHLPPGTAAGDGSVGSSGSHHGPLQLRLHHATAVASPPRPSAKGAASDPAPRPAGPATTSSVPAAVAPGDDGTADDRRKPRSNIPGLVCAILASMTTGGTTYAFGLYGADLKAALRLRPSELDTLSTAFFLAGLASWLPGLVVDRFGTRRGMALGGSLGATSLIVYWLVSKQLIWRHWLFDHHGGDDDGRSSSSYAPARSLQPSAQHSALLVPILSMLGIMIFLSCALVTASVFKIIVSTCGPSTKGSAVGVAKGYVGLGAGAYACLLEALRFPKQSHLDFLPMAALCFLGCAVAPALLWLPTQQQVATHLTIEDEATPRHFRVLYASLAAMATTIVVTSMQALSDGRESHQNVWVALLIVTVWVGPIVGLLWLPRNNTRRTHAPSLSMPEEGAAGLEPMRIGSGPKAQDSLSALHHPLARTGSGSHGDISLTLVMDHPTDGDLEMADDNEEQEVMTLLAAEDLRRKLTGPSQRRHCYPDAPGEPIDFTLPEMLRTPSAWLMLWTCTMLVGAGTVETNNMGLMVEAMGFPETVTPASLALFSVAQAMSRVATGAMSDVALDWNTRRFGTDSGVPRPFFFVVASLVAFLAHGLLSVAKRQFGFVVGVTLSGAAFGMCWPLMVLVSGEVFGTANAGANYMFYDGFTSAIGTLLLTKGLSQRVYEEHIDPTSLDPDTCIGKACFELTHILIALLSLTCVATSGCMIYTSRYAYNRQSASPAGPPSQSI